jgi:hypothetical protein
VRVIFVSRSFAEAQAQTHRRHDLGRSPHPRHTRSVHRIQVIANEILNALSLETLRFPFRESS